MRPQRLTLTAFGPFGQTVDVDFDDLSNFGVFRIHGDTGAGKTSLLDGMTFALFGQVSGSRLVGGLRSQHAESSLETSVALEFSAHGNDWRITRKPPQMRAAKRGGGMKEDKYQTATLMRRSSGAWTPVATRLGEVNDEIRRLVGLDHQQFTQVVVLPQGEFQKALRATSNERMELLRTLFGTDRFDTYAKRLKETAEALRVERDRLRADVGHLDTTVRHRAGELGIDVDAAAIVEESQLIPLLTNCNDALRDAEEELDTLADNEAELRSQLDALNVAAQNHQRRVGAQRRIEVLEEQRPNVDLARAELAGAHRVAGAVPAMQRLDTTRRRLGLALHKHSSAIETFRSKATRCDLQAVTPLLDGEIDGTTVDAVIESLKTSIVECGRSIERLEATVALIQAAAQLRERLDSLTAQRDAVAGECAATDDECKHVDAELEALSNAAATADQLAERVTSGEARLDTLDQLEATQAKVRTAHDAALNAREAENDARAHYLGLVESRLANMAGELASRLTNDEPCSVCGSTTHPAPALISEGAGAEEIRSAEERWNKCSATSGELQKTHSDLRERVAELRAQLGNDGEDRQLAEERLDSLRTQLAAALEARRQMTVLQNRLDRARARHSQLDAQLDTIDAEIVRVSALLEHASAEVDKSGDPNASPADLTASRERLSRFEMLRDQVMALATSVRELEAARTSAEDDETHLREIAASIGIEDLDEVAAMARNEQAMAELGARVNDWDHRDAAAREVLDDPAVAAATEAPDLSGVQEQLAGITARAGACNARKGLLQSAKREFERAHNLLSDHARRTKATEDAYDRAARLAGICNGAPGSASRMSLERYVLAAHLEEVAGVASKRLSAMTEGRFTLRHSDAGAPRNAASGLGLLVKDAHTGDEREVSTLSGGETFLASLALALGLSDVVQRHAGGVRMDVLFVDEGFGSLDANKLELAMAHLDQVRAGGRVVGIISHVADLKDRIPAGIEVVQGNRGSTVRTASPYASAV